jgi:DNA-binding response OmpR family regulator
MRKILIIDDDTDLSELLEFHLAENGFALSRAATAGDGLLALDQAEYDLVLLDIMLPDRDGFEVCRIIRSRFRNLPVIMLTSRTEEIDKILGLELGADDYITKPFSVRELLARVKTVLRRIEERKDPPEDETIIRGELLIRVGLRRVELVGAVLSLTATEFDLLLYLARHPGRPFTREHLLQAVWGYAYAGYENTVNSHVNRLRSKIEVDPANPRFIRTVWGVGYRFAEQAELAGG